MANDVEVKIGFQVDDSPLKEADKIINNLQNESIKPNINFSSAMSDVNKLQSLFNKIFGKSFDVKIKNKKDLTKFLNDTIRLLNKAKTAASEGIDISKLSFGGAKTSRGFSNVITKAIKSGRNEIVSSLQKEFDAIDVPMPKIDYKNFQQSINQAQNILKESQQNIKNTFNQIQGDLSLSFSGIDSKSVSKLKSNLNSISSLWEKDFPQALNKAKSYFKEFGNEVGIVFSKIETDEISFTKKLDNITSRKFTYNPKTQTSNVEDIKKIEEAYRVVETGNKTLLNSLKAEQTTKLYDFISESLKKAGADIDKYGNNIKDTIQSVYAKFDSEGKLIGASVKAIADDVKAAFNFTVNESGGLAFSGATIVNESEIKKQKELKSTMEEVIARKKELISLKSSGKTSEVAQVEKEIASRETLISTLKNEIKNKELVDKLSSSYSERTSRITAKADDVSSIERSSKALQEYIAALNQAQSAQSKISSKSKADMFNSAQIQEYKNNIQSLIPILQKLGIEYDEVTNSFKFDQADFSGLLESEKDVEKLIQKYKEFQQVSKMSSAKSQDIQITQAYKDAEKALDRVIQKKKELAQAQHSGNLSDSGITRMKQDLIQLEETLTRAELKLKNFGNAKITGSFDELKNIRLNNLDSDLDKIKNQLNNTHSATEKLSGGFDGLLQRGLSMAASFTVFDKLQEAIFGAADAVVELNTQMTNLQIVTEYSDTSMENMMSNYVQMAKDLGVTLTDVTEGAGEWLNLTWLL